MCIRDRQYTSLDIIKLFYLRNNHIGCIKPELEDLARGFCEDGPTSPVPDLFAGTLFAQPQTSTPENSGPIQGDLFANFAGEGTGVSENSNLTRLEMLDVDSVSYTHL